MRRATIVALLAVLAACGAASAGEPGTSLRIDAWPNGPGTRPHRVWTLRCNPAGGTLPRAAAACRALARVERPFAPVPQGAVCTQIYGGPAYATVRGRFRGQIVRTSFRRRNGCEIARWNRVEFLFPGVARAFRPGG